MNTIPALKVDDIVNISGTHLPRNVNFNDLIVTGPPGCGKTSLIQSLGGWPMEGYIDLAKNNWWRDPVLAYRPREVHFGLPFEGHKRSHAVFDPEWMKSPTPIVLDRVRIPPDNFGRIFRRNWRSKYVFYFLLPQAEQLYAIRSGRAWLKSHPVDEHLSEELVEKQLQAYQALALQFQRCGLRVYIQQGYSGQPMRIVNTDANHAARNPTRSPQNQSEAAQVWVLFR